MTNPTPYWREAEWRKRHGFESIAKLTWQTPSMRELTGSEKYEARSVYGLRKIGRELGLSA